VAAVAGVGRLRGGLLVAGVQPARAVVDARGHWFPEDRRGPRDERSSSMAQTFEKIPDELTPGSRLSRTSS
jgi:hypothetical protein